MQTDSDDGLVLVATYERVIGASSERVWENVLDWEHLPWLHSGSFASIELERSDETGWRALVGVGSRGQSYESLIEVSLDRPRSRYTTSTLSGIGEGTKIVTQLDSVGDRKTAIDVRFFVPGVTEADADGVGALYLDLYARLWDEDEEMMQHRQRVLDERAKKGERSPFPRTIVLGVEADVRARVPMVVSIGDRRVRVLELNGELLLHDVVCPHLGGPLDEAGVEDGSIVCPWHGFRFDLRTGRGMGGCSLRLADIAHLDVDPESREVRLIAF